MGYLIGYLIGSLITLVVCASLWHRVEYKRYDKAELSCDARLYLDKYKVCKEHHGQIRSDHAVRFIEHVIDPKFGDDPDHKPKSIFVRLYWRLRYPQ